MLVFHEGLGLGDFAMARARRHQNKLRAFEDEMRTAEVRDWQVISYGNTLHGFTNPAADGSMMRTVQRAGRPPFMGLDARPV